MVAPSPVRISLAKSSRRLRRILTKRYIPAIAPIPTEYVLRIRQRSSLRIGSRGLRATWSICVGGGT